MKQIIMYLMIVFAPHIALAESVSLSCIDGTSLGKISRAFPQFKSIAKIHPTGLCEEQTDENTFAILRTLDLILNLKMPKQKYWDYLVQRSRILEIDDSLPETTLALINIAAPGRVILGPGFFERSVGVRASVLLHEVRHFDGYDHVRCRRGPFKGRYGCDQSLKQNGSYAISYYSSLLMADDPSLNPEERLDIQEYALRILRNNINHP